MKREIKFRCFALNKMYYSKDCFGICPNGSYWQYAEQGYFVNTDFELMQFPGMKDVFVIIFKLCNKIIILLFVY